jgi:hypothetical protein
MSITVPLLLAVIALICGILMLIPGGRWGRFPLTAIAIICLALNQTGFIK